MKYKKTLITRRLVKSKDLNHHGTLFAGTMASWFIESTFIHASNIIGSCENLVCLKTYELLFKKSVKKGSIIRFETRLAKIGKSSITIYCNVCNDHNNEKIIDGFVTFVHIDSNGKPLKHNLKYKPGTKFEKDLINRLKGYN